MFGNLLQMHKLARRQMPDVWNRLQSATALNSVPYSQEVLDQYLLVCIHAYCLLLSKEKSKQLGSRRLMISNREDEHDREKCAVVITRCFLQKVISYQGESDQNFEEIVVYERLWSKKFSRVFILFCNVYLLFMSTREGTSKALRKMLEFPWLD